MRASLLLVLAAAFTTLAACGGAIAPQSDDKQTTTTGGTTSAEPGPVSSSKVVPPEPPSACSSGPIRKNPPGCPASYSSAYQGQPCSMLNLDCAYPGAGDLDTDGCAATAGLWCRLGPGGGSFEWFATQ